MVSIVTATFKTRLAAEQALRNLETIGVTEEQVSFVITDDTRGQSFNIDEGTKADEGAAGGATAGGLIGAVLGAVGAAGSLIVPGLNLVVTGSLVGALAGLATGAVAGGLIGGLIGAGIPEHEAKIYENEIRSGAILIAVKPRDADQKKQIREIFQRSDAYNLAA